jgi:hypothetical protein
MYVLSPLNTSIKQSNLPSGFLHRYTHIIAGWHAALPLSECKTTVGIAFLDERFLWFFLFLKTDLFQQRRASYSNSRRTIGNGVADNLDTLLHVPHRCILRSTLCNRCSLNAPEGRYHETAMDPAAIALGCAIVRHMQPDFGICSPSGDVQPPGYQMDSLPCLPETACVPATTRCAD